MHILEDKIAHIRPLRAADFKEDDGTPISMERDEPVCPEQQSSPLKLMVCRALYRHWIFFSLCSHSLPVSHCVLLF
jgi:hypothetical protein